MSNRIHRNLDFANAIYGMILGDASLVIRKERKTKSATLAMRHSLAQERYLDFKKSFIEKFINCSSFYHCQLDNRTSQIYHGKFLKTRSHPWFRDLRNLFYPNGKKIVPYRIIKNLTPQGFAFLYMDDGFKTLHCKNGKLSSRSIAISTYCFSDAENEMICNRLRDFEILARVSSRNFNNREQYYVKMNASNGIKFANLIAPYLLPMFKYKIDFNYSYGKYQRLMDNIHSKIGVNVKDTVGTLEQSREYGRNDHACRFRQ